MIRLIVMAALLVWPALSCAQVASTPTQTTTHSPAPATYKTASGQWSATVMASPVCGTSSSGSPQSCQSGNTAPMAYKNASGQWQASLMIAPVCSLDANGHPQACQFGGSGGGAASTYANPTPATITQPSSGSAPSGATQIAATLTQVSACTTTTQPLQLPAGPSSGVATYVVVNSGSAACNVYPPSGGSIGAGSANIPDVLMAGETHSYNGINASEYLASGALAQAQTDARYLQSSPQAQQTLTYPNYAGLQVTSAAGGDNRNGVSCTNCSLFAGNNVVAGYQLTAAGNILLFDANYTIYGFGITPSSVLRTDSQGSNASLGLGVSTYANLPTNAQNGDEWICSNCTVTYNSTTITGVKIWWNTAYGSNGGWDYDARILGATFGHP